jgi:hypothetical protein
MITLERRLARIEKALQPQPPQPFCLLVEPLTDESPEAFDVHRQQIEEAKARGDFVAIVSSAGPGGRPPGDKGVTYYPNEFEARLVEASRLPSRLGNKSLLDDVFKSAMGKVWGPVVSAEEEGYTGIDLAM